MGAPTIYEGDPREADVDVYLANEGNAEEPIETFVDGCPGSWYRCRWFDSVLRYVRPCSGDGVYSENILLTRSHDPLVLEAVQYYQTEQARARRWFHDEAEGSRPPAEKATF